MLICNCQFCFVRGSGHLCRTTIDIGQEKKKEEGKGQIGYNEDTTYQQIERRFRSFMSKSITKSHGLLAIPNEVCREIQRKPSRQEVQQMDILGLWPGAMRKYFLSEGRSKF